MREYHVDDDLKIREFFDRMYMAGHRIVPQVYLKPSEGKEGNARHLIHDCKGILVPRLPNDDTHTIRGIVDPSALETLREAVKQDYLQEAKIVWTSQREEILKRLNS